MLSIVLLVLVLALYALAIYLARGERRETLRNIGFALVLVGLIVLVVRRVTGNVVVDALTSPQGEAGGRQAWLIGSELLSQLGWAEVLYGAIVVAATIFAGPTGAATSVRGGSRRCSTSARSSPGPPSPPSSSCSSCGAARTRCAPGGASCCSAR